MLTINVITHCKLWFGATLQKKTLQSCSGACVWLIIILVIISCTDLFLYLWPVQQSCPRNFYCTFLSMSYIDNSSYLLKKNLLEQTMQLQCTRALSLQMIYPTLQGNTCARALIPSQDTRPKISAVLYFDRIKHSKILVREKVTTAFIWKLQNNLR